MRHYNRRLPHWDAVGTPMFVTFRLHNSIPAGRIFPPSTLKSGRAFLAFDRILDRAATGPVYLRLPEIADLVVKALKDGDQRFHRYQLHAYVVMANHVHALVTPAVPAAKWLGPLKGYTAHEANRILGHAGGTFWQEESYDHLVRDGTEFRRIQSYIEANPVKAGVVTAPDEHPWSSAA